MGCRKVLRINLYILIIQSVVLTTLAVQPYGTVPISYYPFVSIPVLARTIKTEVKIFLRYRIFFF